MASVETHEDEQEAQEAYRHAAGVYTEQGVILTYAEDWGTWILCVKE